MKRNFSKILALTVVLAMIFSLLQLTVTTVSAEAPAGQVSQKVYLAQDTFIDSGNPTLPQYASATLYARGSGSLRTPYIYFDCSQYQDKYITGAKLYLNYFKDPAIYTTQGGSLPVSGLTDNSWVDNIQLITWNNRATYFNDANLVSCGNLEIPAGEDVFDKYYSVDVTNYIKAMAGSTKFSFKIQGSSTINSAYKFRSSDYSVESARPYLEIYYNPDGIDAQSVTLNKTQLQFETGDQSIKLTAQVLPVLATKPYVTWNSSNTSIATVSNKGVVTPVSPGAAVITATSGDGKAHADCNVTVTKRLDSIKVYPLMDTFADGGNKDVVSGGYDNLYARSGTSRIIFMKFDLSGVDSERVIHSADLNMYYFYDQTSATVNAINGGSLPVSGISDNNWDESVLTWNTGRPSEASAQFINNLVVDSQANDGFDKFYKVDITSYALETVGGITTLRIEGDQDIANMNKAYKFHSQNYTTAAMRPYIEIKYEPIGAAPTTPSIADVTVSDNTIQSLKINANNTEGVVIIALYTVVEGKSTLYDIAKFDVNAEDYNNYDATINNINKVIPEGASYKVMFWNSLTQIKPLCAFASGS